MKLRNKKTGEIVTIGHEPGDDFDGVGLMLWFDHVEGSELDDHKIYGSLAELNEEWEDLDATIVRTKNRIEFLERKLKSEKALLTELCGEEEE